MTTTKTEQIIEPALPFVNPEEAARLKKLVEEEFGGKYFNITLVNQGAQTLIFTANFASPDGAVRTIKVDRTELNTRSEKYRQRN